ncbi:MAG: hypothetical protein ACJAYH_002334, partial [Celeribacter sp.]
RDRSCQRRFTVVNVANCADVAVRFITLELFLSHIKAPLYLEGAESGPNYHRGLIIVFET